MSGQSRKIATANARRVRSTVQRAEQQPYRTAPDRRAPRLGAPPRPVAFCQLAGSLGPATGTWPTIAPTHATETLYAPQLAGGVVSFNGIGTAEVYNFRSVTWAAGKTTFLAYTGGLWCVVDQDC